jgi:hypothetical protein
MSVIYLQRIRCCEFWKGEGRLNGKACYDCTQLQKDMQAEKAEEDRLWRIENAAREKRKAEQQERDRLKKEKEKEQCMSVSYSDIFLFSCSPC